MKINLMRLVLILAAIFAMVSLLTSCGQRSWQTRGEKKGWIKNTIDTIVTEKVEADTIFKHTKDTVFVKKDKLTMKYFHTDSTVYLYGKCDSDTVRVNVPMIEYKDKEYFGFKDKYWAVTLCLLALFAIWRLTRKS